MQAISINQTKDLQRVSFPGVYFIHPSKWYNPTFAADLSITEKHVQYPF